MPGEKLVAMMMKAGKTPDSKFTEIVMGEVISVDPIKVKVRNLIFTSDFLMLSPFCYDKKITVNSTTVTVWEGLKVGDLVSMLRVSDGQLYYIMQKEV